MNKVTWIIDKTVVHRLSMHNKKIHEVVKDQGHECVLVGIKPSGFPDIPELDLSGINVLYGSHPFVRQVIKKYPDLGYAALGINDRTVAASYLSNLPLDWMLNDKAIFMTWKMFKYRGPSGFSNYKKGLFIRPNSGFKTFAGQTIMFDTWNDTIDMLEQVSSVVDDTMILISPLQEIQGEFRFVIVNNNVITGSEYRWDNKLDIRIDYPDDCFELANKVAKHNWQVDFAYVVDVALTPNGPKVIELNSFSCAGLYACDLTKIVDAVSNTMYTEYTGEGSY